MPKKQILIYGYFGYFTNQIDGQTIKTREIHELIKSKLKDETILQFDTQVFKKNKFKIFKVFSLLHKSKLLICLPGKNNLRYIFPFIFIYCKLFNIKIIYAVVGGWLADFIKTKPILEFILKKIDFILVESNSLKGKLETEFKYNNINVLPNFRSVLFEPQLKKDSIFKIVFMARIVKQKGVDFIFDFARYYKKNNIKFPIEINFYGPISEKFKKSFYLNVNKYPYVRYGGIVEPKDVYNILANHDVLVLPSYYEGEGFPGSIIDAYIAGIPVIVSKWKDFPEFVDDGLTGFTFDLSSPESFFDYILLLQRDNKLLTNMKRQSKIKADEYSPEKAWEVFKNCL